MNTVAQLGVLVLLSVGMSCGINRMSHRQLRAETQACQCQCGYVEAAWPWRYPGLLSDGEYQRTAWGGGTLVCLRTGEDYPRHRLAEIQREIYMVDCARGLYPAESAICAGGRRGR